MNAAEIISFITLLLTAVFMLGIGISQMKSKDPVAFYSGETPLKRQQLSDVSAWNKKHALMWLSYGILIMAVSILAVVIGMDDVYCVILILGGLMVPIPLMIAYHHVLIKRYKTG